MQFNIDFTLHLPGDVTLLKTISFLLLFSLGTLFVAVLARLLLGKNSSLKASVASGLSIVMMYAICIVVYTFIPKDLTGYINRLPLGAFGVNDAGEKVLILNTFAQLDFPDLCHQLLRIFLLGYLVNQINSYTPDKLKLLGWICFRMFSIVVAIGIYYAMDKVINIFLPFIFVKYAPMILLSILAFSFMMGFLKFILGLMLTAVNPLFGAFYAFFFSNKVGKNMSRGIGSTIVIVSLVLILHHLGYGTIPIGVAALDSYIPFTLCMFVLWIIVGRVL